MICFVPAKRPVRDLSVNSLNIAFQVPLASKWWWNMALYHKGIGDCVTITFVWYCRLGVELGASQAKQRNLASWHERCDILYGWVNDKYVRLRSRPTSPESSFGGIKRQQSVIEVRLYVTCKEQIFFQWTPTLTTEEFTFCCFPEVKLASLSQSSWSRPVVIINWRRPINTGFKLR